MPNPVRNCILCGQRDDHPRHVVDIGGGQEAAYHMDCHTRTTPPCGICTHQLLDAPTGAIGQALRDHIVSLPPKSVHPDGSIEVHHPGGRSEWFGADGLPVAPAAAPGPVAPVSLAAAPVELGEPAAAPAELPAPTAAPVALTDLNGGN